jgi:hypothetical protein
VGLRHPPGLGMIGCMQSEIRELLPISEAARRIKLSAQRLRTLADAGRVPCVRSPLGRLFDPADLDAFAATRGPFGRYMTSGAESKPEKR